MLLKNWYSFLNGLLRAAPSFSGSSVSVRSYDGSVVTPRTVNYGSSSSFDGFNPFALSVNDPMYGTFYALNNTNTIYYGNSSSTSNVSTCGVLLGDGDVQPTFDDYKLSGNIITDFSAVTSMSVVETENGLEMTAIYNITNTGSSDITIKEIGNTRYGGPNIRILITRDVLSNPVIIAPGNSGIITYKLKIN